MPINTYPPFLIGRYITSVAVAGVVPNGDGTFTVSVATAGDLHTGQALDGFTFNPRNQGEDITPIDYAQANNVTTLRDFNVTVSELRQFNTTSLLTAIWNGFDYFRLQRNFSTSGGGTNTFAVIARVGDLRETPSRGAARVELTGDSAGIAPYWGPVASLPF